MFKTLSKEFIAARMAVECVRDPAEVSVIASLAKQRELFLRCDQIQAQREASTPLGDFNFVPNAWVAKEPIPETDEMQGNGAESAHNKALYVANAAMDGFSGSHMERACLFVTTYAAALKVVAA